MPLTREQIAHRISLEVERRICGQFGDRNSNSRR